MSEPWTLYVLRLVDGSLYCGVANDLERRVREQTKGLARASKCVKAKLPAELVYYKEYPDKSAAMVEEWQFKHLPKSAKEERIRR